MTLEYIILYTYVTLINYTQVMKFKVKSSSEICIILKNENTYFDRTVKSNS